MSSENGNGKQVQIPMAPQYVEPGPLNEVWATNGAPTKEGREIVRIEIHSSAGRFVHFMDPDTAIGVGKQISDQGHKSKIARHIIKGGG